MKKYLTILAGLFGYDVNAASTKTVELRGLASFYAYSYIGKTMANGQPYNPRAFTLACDDVPLGTVLYLTYDNGKGMVRHAHATVTDRGPAQQYRNAGRIFDLSYSLFCFLENPKVGLIRITARVVP